MFIDRIEIELFAGRGGDGCLSFRREKFVPRGGPDGGDGGHGGSVILRARVGTNSLAAFSGRRLYRAEKGRPGQGSLRHGRNGKDLRLDVPCGTSVIDAADGYVIRDLTRPDETFTAARGGRGGHGNARFKTSVNQAPRQRTLGTDGESRHVILELKSIADVGLLGKPNAGKSTLLSRISSARPEIADYPFTTKHPNLGIVDVDADQSFILADIPGLIEGASDGVGLGHEFLKHVQRAGLLVHLVEPEPMDESEPIENYETIRRELSQFDQQLAARDELVVLTKCELDPDQQIYRKLAEHLSRSTEPSHRRELMAISAAADIGLQQLKREIMTRVADLRREMINAGQEPTPIRKQDVTTTAGSSPRRLPPHKAPGTRDLSNQRQARDVVAESTTPTSNS